MKKLYILFYILITSICANAQFEVPTVDFPHKIGFFMPDGQRQTLRTPFSYIGDSMLFNGTYTTDNDYYRNPQSFLWDDTMFVPVFLTKGHVASQGGVRIIKYQRTNTSVVPNQRRLYTSQVSDRAVKYENLAINYSLIDDTIFAIRYNAPLYSNDTIIKLDRNFNRIGQTIFFDKTGNGLYTQFLCVSKIFKDDSGYFYMAGYETLPFGQYQGRILRSPNRGRTWSIVKTFPFVDNSFKPEELSIAQGAGDTLLCFMRSDFGFDTWMSKSANGITWTDAVRVFNGANQPRAITISDSIIVVTSRLVGWARAEEEIQPLNDTTNGTSEAKHLYTYTSFNISWDYGNNWYEFFVDRERTERYMADESEVSDIVQIGASDTVRIYWAQGFYSGETHAYGDFNYADFIVNKKVPGLISFMGGISDAKTKYYRFLRSDSLQLLDTANRTYASIDVDNRNLNITGTIDTVKINATTRIEGSLGVNTPLITTGYFLELRDPTREVDRIRATSGALSYERAAGAPEFRLHKSNGTTDAPTPPTIGQQLGAFGIGGYNSGLRTDFKIDAYAANNFGATDDVNLFFSKTTPSTGFTPVPYHFVDSINRAGFGHYLVKPIFNYGFNINRTLALTKDSIPHDNTSTMLLVFDTSTNQVKRLTLPTSATTLTGLSTKNILFGSANGQQRQDTSFAFDSVNKYVGIGTGTPTARLHLYTTSSTAGTNVLRMTTGSTGIPTISFARTNGGDEGFIQYAHSSDMFRFGTTVGLSASTRFTLSGTGMSVLNSSAAAQFGIDVNGTARFVTTPVSSTSTDSVATYNPVTNQLQKRPNGILPSNGGGFKHARVTTGSVSAGSTSLVTITWATPFSDANYTVNASVLDATTTSLSLSVVHIESITANDVTVRVLNNAVGALTGTVHVIAVHD